MKTHTHHGPIEYLSPRNNHRGGMSGILRRIFGMRRTVNPGFNTNVSPVELLKTINVYPKYWQIPPVKPGMWDRMAVMMTSFLTVASFMVMFVSEIPVGLN